MKNQRLVATKSCAKTSNHWHPEGWVASARPYWPCSELYRGHQGHWQIKGKDGRKAGKKVSRQEEAMYSKKGPKVTWWGGIPGCRVRPATGRGCPGRHRHQQRHAMSSRPSNWVVQGGRRNRTVYFPHPQECCLRAGLLSSFQPQGPIHSIGLETKSKKEPNGH